MFGGGKAREKGVIGCLDVPLWVIYVVHCVWTGRRDTSMVHWCGRVDASTHITTVYHLLHMSTTGHTHNRTHNPVLTTFI